MNTKTIAYKFDFNLLPKSQPSPDVVTNTNVGVEVELEGEGLHKLMHSGKIFWSVHREGSLREGTELVFKSPLSGSDIPAALEELEDEIKSSGVVIIDSPRTSLHVHIDVRELTLNQFRNFCLLYIILERILFKVCGEERYNNTFCSSSEFHDDILLPLFEDNDRTIRSILKANNNRYLALNLGAVKRFGSLEFRGHKCTWKKEEILRWINLLLSLRKYSVENDFDFKSISFTVSEVGHDIFLRSVFGKHYKEIISPDNQMDLLLGLRRAQDIFYHKELKRVQNSLFKKEVYNCDRGITSPAMDKYKQLKEG